MHRSRLRLGGLALAVGLLLGAPRAEALGLTGDQTTVLLTSAGALNDLGISVSPLGMANIMMDIAGRAEALFPITGGDLTGFLGTIEHDMSGLRLSGGGNQLDLENFVITALGASSDPVAELSGDVTVNGSPAGQVPLFRVDNCLALFGTPGQCQDGDGSLLLQGFKLSLLPDAAQVIEDLFGADLSGAQVGVAALDIRFVPEPGTLALVGLGVAAVAMRRRRA